MRQGVIGSPISLRVQFYDNGVLFNPTSIGPVTIYDAPIGGTLLATITPTQVSTGLWQAVFNIPSILIPETLYDFWQWTAISSMPSNTKMLNFSIVEPAPTPPPPPRPVNVECHPHPSWLQYDGIQTTQDVGNGMSLNLTWGEAEATSDNQFLFYNVYYSTTRFGVFDSGPQAVTADTSTTISITPGQAYYTAVRASELTMGDAYFMHMTQIGANLYQYPPQLTLEDTLDAYGVAVQVSDTTGYPDIGVLLVGTDAYGYELMKYTSVDGYNFYVDVLDRGYYGSLTNSHSIGENVSLWRGFEETNTNIAQDTADWIQAFGVPRNIDAYGQPNVDQDGYRAALEDDLTTTLSASELSVENFSTYDFNSYHRPSLQDTFDGNHCLGSYVGGEFNGTRGFNLQDRLLSQLESMIQLTGEPIVILRRKWTGQRCGCISLRREHQRSRCGLCYDTGFIGGYDRLFNNRAISESFDNTSGMFMMRVTPYTDDLEIVQEQGLRQPDELTAWCLTIPNIKDRDIIVRFDQSGIEEFRYVVLNVTRNKLFFNQTGRQDIRMRRLDKTDQIMEYSTSDPSKFIII